MNIYHTKTAEEVAVSLKTDTNCGLSSSEAFKRLKKNGENKLLEKKKSNIFVKFVSQFNDFMIMVLLASAFISFITNLHEGENAVAEPVIILLIVVINAILGVIQEYKAEKSIEKLKNLSLPYANVIRDGKKCVIKTLEVVVGDILLLGTGDIACADGRIFEAVCLEADESGLTGESIPVHKDTDILKNEETALGDRTNMIMSGTAITGGSGKIIVTATGMNTEMGQIAGLIIESEAPLTPLQKRLSDIGKILGISALFICCLVFLLGIYSNIPPSQMFINAVSLAVAAIPEGLPAIITIMLAVGVRKMAAKNAIMKNLPSVETLGSASIICSDKTGTLTMNKMTVKDVFSDDKGLCIKNASLCCEPDTKNPTELAILNCAKVFDIDFEKLHELYPIQDRLSFTSSRKKMSTLHKISDKWVMITKGAPDYILNECTHYLKNGEALPMDLKTKDIIKRKNDEYTKQALRVICVSKKVYDKKPCELKEKGLIYMGLIALSDPPRPEVKNSVKMCRDAGIHPVMITGDYPETAFSIAKETGICNDRKRVITGNILDKMSDNELTEKITDFDVYARVTPLHKLRIVKAWQAKSEIVAMTGDGVNDAPALKAADIGCCPGKMGTDVAKASADMIMTDDNFATIVDAVREGRIIFANIKKSIRFLLSSNLGEIITVFGCLIMGSGTPLSAIALLWVNLVTDSLPATALSVDPPDSDIMTKKKNNKIFDRHMISSIITEGALIGALTLFAYSLSNVLFGSGKGAAVAFSVLSISQLVHAFNMRSEKSVFKAGIFKNKYLVLSFILGVILQLTAVSVPRIALVFKVETLGWIEWLVVFALSVVPLVVCELQKMILR